MPMTNWMLRGLAFAAAMVVLRLFQGALINAWQMLSGLISWCYCCSSRSEGWCGV